MKVLSLFSGIGGLDLAAEWAGMEIVAQCEIDPFCQSILRRHWPHVRLFDDIRAVTADAAGHGSQGCGISYGGGESNCPRPYTEPTGIRNQPIDLITGGFPCQPVSAAGKRRGKDDDRWLWPEMLRVIREIQPAWVVGENVAGLITMGLDGCISDLEEAGYSVQAFVIPACAVNALHRRDRVFIVAHADEPRPQGRDGAELQECSRKSTSWPSGTQAAACISIAENQCGTCRGTSGTERQTISRICDMAHGLPSWMAGGWAEPARLKQSEPGRVNKLKALGNAVVPAQAYPIFRAIMGQADDSPE